MPHDGIQRIAELRHGFAIGVKDAPVRIKQHDRHRQQFHEGLGRWRPTGCDIIPAQRFSNDPLATPDQEPAQTGKQPPQPFKRREQRQTASSSA
ncbi:hypothetical protein AA101099_2984 [Neoasaia chiangmaiensis NBRC 101099]|nr:hypothetical protein AA101099_2984 [Neoasaia chiangmaiensis NBRC 101099]GEN16195.1 hypothetical protein NCH01_26260 [Neoasaia chiangmaiensis]